MPPPSTSTPPRRAAAKSMKQPTLVEMAASASIAASSLAPVSTSMPALRSATSAINSTPTRATRVSPRARRTPPAFTHLREPYQAHSVVALKQECVRRGIHDQRRVDGNKKRPETKVRFIELLREADMLAQFAQTRSVLAPAPVTPVRKAARKKRAPRQKRSSSASLKAAAPTSNGNAPESAKTTSATTWTDHVHVIDKPNSAILPITGALAMAMEPNLSPAQIALSRPVAVKHTNEAIAGQADQTTKTTSTTVAAPTRNPIPEVVRASPAPPVTAAPARVTVSSSAPRSGTRARRGCRFRLINVLLSSDFQSRWPEMHTPAAAGQVNGFWRDVHVSYLCQNSFYDKLQFEDALFVNVSPELILNHTAQKLQQIWSEITLMYRRVVSSQSRPNSTGDSPKTFFASCGGRLDMLYLHMGLLLEPRLKDLILSGPSKARSTTTSATQRNTSSANSHSPRTTSHARSPSIGAEAVRSNVAAPVFNNTATSWRAAIRATNPVFTRGADASRNESLQLRTNPPKSSESTSGRSDDEVKRSFSSSRPGPKLVELQNPEMLPDWLIEDQAKTAAARGNFPAPSTRQAVHHKTESRKAQNSDLLTSTATAQNKNTPKSTSTASKPSNAKRDSSGQRVESEPAAVPTTDLVLHSSAINSIDDDSASSDYEAADDVNFSRGKRRSVAGKRRRAPPTDLMEIPTSRDIVPHPHKRVHTAVTTTMTRSQELMLPPDEFDVLHNRLRKMNECIDQCYRTMSSGDGILNEMHREDVESDLRFYLGIKKRLQEQIVMFMHGY